MAAQQYENETDFLVKAVPPLARALGWGDDQLFFEMRLQGLAPMYADAVLAPTRTAPPLILIEVRMKPYEPQTGLLQRMRMMMAASGASLGVYLSPGELVVFDARGERAIGVDSAPADFEMVRSALKNPGAPTQPEEKPAPDSPGSTFEGLLQAVDSATTNDEKKKSLESLAAALLSGMPSWRCKYTNLVTRSAEIDIVVEQTGAVPDALAEFGRYALVECKNWQRPVDAKHIRDFIGKMQSARVRLGIVFSMRGVTGEEQGTDALREIQKAYAMAQTAVVVISREDFRACADPKQFLALVDERIDRLRFDL
jgi:Restriction endonuclease